ncbi:hypothetical protein IMSHALPRED_005092 [Imshaugia aleurites]|uniref:Uncharacterized protein n=1 Tax=Imshaugia aleurites TaxID=172621 RepID=A0A8H3FAM4_9LECA|nr:hypothetical protein IMSHALPRED_005092 [Imshaugia aleurites]
MAPTSSNKKQPILTFPKLAPSAPPKDEEREPVIKREPVKKVTVVKKGIAVRKPVPEKPKPKWRGWLEMPSDEEEEYKMNVDAAWAVEDGIKARRTRASKAMGDEDETGMRRLRARSRREYNTTMHLDTDSEESVHEKEEEEEEEEEENDEEEEDEEENFVFLEDSMDVYEETESEDEETTEDSFDPLYDVSETDPPTPRPVRTKFENAPAHVDSGSQRAPRSSTPARSDSDSGNQPRIPWSPSPERSRRITVASPELVPPVPSTSEDNMERRVEGAFHHVFAPPLYPSQGNRWGFPECAVRSTLPRLA